MGLKLLSSEVQNEEVIVGVQDNGIGIPADRLRDVFDPFERLDAHVEGGLELGLTLVKRLVELHGGNVEAASAGLGHGSEFTVRLPRAGAAAAERSTARAQSSTPSAAALPRRILVVDDNVDAANSIAMLIEMLGSEVRTAHDGVTALEIIDTFRPMVVLLDLGLPDLSGYEVTRRMRSRAELNEVQLVALTGWGTRGRSEPDQAGGIRRASGETDRHRRTASRARDAWQRVG